MCGGSAVIPFETFHVYRFTCHESLDGSLPCRGRDDHGGRIHRVDVLLDHPFGAETGGVGPKTFLHELQPAAGYPVKVSLIVEGNRFLFQYAVELLRVMLVLGLMSWFPTKGSMPHPLAPL